MTNYSEVKVTKIPAVPRLSGIKETYAAVVADGVEYPMFWSEEEECNISDGELVTFELKVWRGKTYAVRVAPRW